MKNTWKALAKRLKCAGASNYPPRAREAISTRPVTRKKAANV